MRFFIEWRTLKVVNGRLYGSRLFHRPVEIQPEAILDARMYAFDRGASGIGVVTRVGDSMVTDHSRHYPAAETFIKTHTLFECEDPLAHAWNRSVRPLFARVLRPWRRR